MSSQAFEPLASASPLIVYIDYKSPYAYLAMAPTQELADQLGIAIDWRPLNLRIETFLGSARLNPEGKVVDEARAPGQWTRVKYAYHDVRRYASLRGMVIRGTTKIWNSSIADIGLLWAKRQAPMVLRNYSAIVFEHFWKRELDLEDAAAIARVLEQSGAPTLGFQDYVAGEGRRLEDLMQERAFAAGIFGVPTFVVDRELFHGREHLARIRWTLTGRKGPPPDTSYQDAAIAAARGAGDRKLAVAIDFKSPQSYLAVAPTSATAAELGITLDWMPIVIAPSKASFASADDRGARHRQIRADYLRRDVVRYAADRGLEIDGLSRAQDSTLAAIGLLWIKRERPPLAQKYVERCFAGIGAGRIDAADAASIHDLVVELGAPDAGFASFAHEAGRSALAQLNSELRSRGVFDTPAYLVGDDLFWGRHHLPLIRALLDAPARSA